MYCIFSIIDWTLFIILSLCVGYLFIFAIASLFYKEKRYPNTSERQRFLVLFPAYSEDNVIVNSIKTFLQQDYPSEYYHIITISDHQRDETIEQLHNLPITTLVASYENSSKAKALKLAISTIQGDFDTVVILDADNLAPANFLSEINKIRSAGELAIQVHRRGITNQSKISLLDNISEEINNGIFRKGHQVLGLSSALTGSGMAFDYKWFKTNISKVSTVGEDKELEALLLQQKIHIIYSDQLYVLDKKTDKQEAIGKQRKRWIVAQLNLVTSSIHNLAKAVLSLNVSYTDKILQWMLPPRLIQLGLVFGLSIIISIISGVPNCYKWIILSFIQILAITLPVPIRYWNKDIILAIAHLPTLTLRILANILHIKNKDEFIHTKH